MKKLVCALLAVMLCCTATFAMAEEAERSTRQSKNSMVDWSGLVTESHSGVRDVRSLFSLRLTEAQLGFLAGINLQVFELDESGSYALVSMMPEIDIDGTTLSSEYVHRALFIVDPEGNPISPGLPYTVLDNGEFSVQVALIAHDENGEELYRDLGVMHFVMSNEEGNLQVTEILGFNDLQGSFLQRYTLNLADYDTLEIIRELRTPTEFSGGTLNSWNEWPLTSETVYTCRLSEAEGMMMLHDVIDHSRLYAAFAIRDYQNYYYLSSLIALNAGGLTDGGLQLTTYDDLDMLLLDNAQLSIRENGANTTALLTMDVQNIFGQEVAVRIENVCFEGDATDLTAMLYGFGEHYGLVDQETQRLVLSVPADVLLAHPLLTGITFDLVLVDPVDETVELGRVPVTFSLHQDFSFMQG